MEFPQYENATPSNAPVNTEANGQPPEENILPELAADGDTTQPPSPPQKRPRPRKKGRNYAVIHSNPLPLGVHPLPAFHPSNPLSLLRLCYVYLSHLISPPSSHPQQRYKGHFSPETRSVHVTDPKHVRALWEMGFFGKGSLSRSEPSWVDREKARLKAERGGGKGGTAEEATNARREERRLFKLERARLEREKIERQRMVEEGSLTAETNGEVNDDETTTTEFADDAAPETDALTGQVNGHLNRANSEPNDGLKSQLDIEEQLIARTPDVRVIDPVGTQLEHLPSQKLPVPEEPELDVENQEHLQITLEEAFFLSYALGVLDVITPSSGDILESPRIAMDTDDQLLSFAQHSTFPPQMRAPTLAPDNQFIINYVVYHHFRSLGWVIRPGVKFSCDYMLYHRGPVFSHAEFAVLIMPAYSHPYWSTEQGRTRRRLKEQKDWWWLHCINRVQSQVRKTLVLCYVDVPPPADMSGLDGKPVDIGALLKGYKVREFLIRRWLANRSRD